MRRFAQLKLFWKENPIRFGVTMVLAILVLTLGFRSLETAENRTYLTYCDNLDKEALIINGSSLTLRDLAFYVAYEEAEVEKQAEVYNPDYTNKYWNLHVDGQFIKLAARNAALQMAIHDEIFYQMAVEDGLSLNQKERELLANTEEDFWNDLCDREGEKGLGVQREDIHKTLEKITLSQKYQLIYAETMRGDYEDYAFQTDCFQSIKEENSVEIPKNVWSRVDFGNVTLSH